MVNHNQGNYTLPKRPVFFFLKGQYWSPSLSDPHIFHWCLHQKTHPSAQVQLRRGSMQKRFVLKGAETSSDFCGRERIHRIWRSKQQANMRDLKRLEQEKMVIQHCRKPNAVVLLWSYTDLYVLDHVSDHHCSCSDTSRYSQFKESI